VVKDLRQITDEFRSKALETLKLVEASVGRIDTGTPIPEDPDGLEPYDALCGRHMRAVEMCIKLFRSYERLQFAEQSQTTRNLLLRMEKLELIESAEQWIDMRDLRNRIVHDYAPDHIEHIYHSILAEFAPVLLRLKPTLTNLKL